MKRIKSLLVAASVTLFLGYVTKAIAERGGDSKESKLTGAQTVTESRCISAARAKLKSAKKNLQHQLDSVIQSMKHSPGWATASEEEQEQMINGAKSQIKALQDAADRSANDDIKACKAPAGQSANAAAAFEQNGPAAAATGGGTHFAAGGGAGNPDGKSYIHQLSR